MSPLLPIFEKELIPWAQEGLRQRLVVAQSGLKKSDAPADVTLTRKSIPGKRVIVRNRRIYGNQRVYYALWPEAGLHELDVPKLVCVLNGTTDIQAGEHIITCRAGHFILLPPQTPLTFSDHLPDKTSNNQESSCTVFEMNLYKDGIHCMIHHCRRGEISSEPNANCLIRHPQSVQTFKLFTEELLSGYAADFTISGYLLAALFLSMSREIAAGHELGPIQAPEKRSAPESVQEIRDYIKAHLHEGLTIEKVARAMYMSPSQFTHYMRRASGQSFGEMLTKCRIEEAKYLLHESKWSLAVIAHQLGFKSSSYFSAFFRRHTGSTPGVYRQNAQNRIIQRKS